MTKPLQNVSKNKETLTIEIQADVDVFPKVDHNPNA